jgi:hypothetical protein
MNETTKTSDGWCINQDLNPLPSEYVSDQWANILVKVYIYVCVCVCVCVLNSEIFR